MFTVPVHISPQILFGALEFSTAIPVTRIGAGSEGGTSYCSSNQKTPISHLVPSSTIPFEEGVRLAAFKKGRFHRDEIHPDSHVLFYRRFLSNQQPCSVCERPLSVFEFNAILPCAHIVHLGCYEEKMINRHPCARCKQMNFKKFRVLDELIKFFCCLYTYQ
ncbi:hypothetical protein V3C99_016085 [Haemonchus contortus]